MPDGRREPRRGGGRTHGGGLRTHGRGWLRTHGGGGWLRTHGRRAAGELYAQPGPAPRDREAHAQPGPAPRGRGTRTAGPRTQGQRHAHSRAPHPGAKAHTGGPYIPKRHGRRGNLLCGRTHPADEASHLSLSRPTPSKVIFTGRISPLSSNSSRSIQVTRSLPSVEPSGWRW